MADGLLWTSVNFSDQWCSLTVASRFGSSSAHILCIHGDCHRVVNFCITGLCFVLIWCGSVRGWCVLDVFFLFACCLIVQEFCSPSFL